MCSKRQEVAQIGGDAGSDENNLQGQRFIPCEQVDCVEDQRRTLFGVVGGGRRLGSFGLGGRPRT